MTTQGTHEEAWIWPCPYCGTTNAIEASVCLGCRAQLRDPEEEDLFTTVATDNAQMVDPSGPRVRESLWSTDAPPEEVVAEEVIVDDVSAEVIGDPVKARFAPGAGQQAQGPSTSAAGFPTSDRDRPATSAGPFSASVKQAANDAAGGGAFAPRHDRVDNDRRVGPPNAFESHRPSEPAPSDRYPNDGYPEPQQHQAPPTRESLYEAPPVTPDENGLSVAVDRMSAHEREQCAVPISVCGALLGDQEVVLGLLAGHLLGHSAVLMLTNTRILIANARRWKPLLDQFLPSSDLTVHVRHDRTVASVTIVQGERLSTVDDIGDVPAAMDLAERIRALSSRTA